MKKLRKKKSHDHITEYRSTLRKPPIPTPQAHQSNPSINNPIPLPSQFVSTTLLSIPPYLRIELELHSGITSPSLLKGALPTLLCCQTIFLQVRIFFIFTWNYTDPFVSFISLI